MAIKVGMVSLGCSKNQVDAEIILAKLRERGYQIHTDSGTCDVVICQHLRIYRKRKAGID